MFSCIVVMLKLPLNMVNFSMLYFMKSTCLDKTVNSLLNKIYYDEGKREGNICFLFKDELFVLINVCYIPWFQSFEFQMFLYFIFFCIFCSFMYAMSGTSNINLYHLPEIVQYVVCNLSPQFMVPYGSTWA